MSTDPTPEYDRSIEYEVDRGLNILGVDEQVELQRQVVQLQERIADLEYDVLTRDSMVEELTQRVKDHQDENKELAHKMAHTTNELLEKLQDTEQERDNALAEIDELRHESYSDESIQEWFEQLALRGGPESFRGLESAWETLCNTLETTTNQLNTATEEIAKAKAGLSLGGIPAITEYTVMLEELVDKLRVDLFRISSALLGQYSFVVEDGTSYQRFSDIMLSLDGGDIGNEAIRLISSQVQRDSKLEGAKTMPLVRARSYFQAVAILAIGATAADGSVSQETMTQALRALANAFDQVISTHMEART